MENKPVLQINIDDDSPTVKEEVKNSVKDVKEEVKNAVQEVGQIVNKIRDFTPNKIEKSKTKKID